MRRKLSGGRLFHLRLWEEIKEMNSKYKVYNTDIARLCGMNAAVVASQLWDAQSNSDAAFYKDGYPWIRASYKRITAFLPFLTVHKVRTAVKKLIKEGVIKVGEHNDSSFDRTHSYAFTSYGKDLMKP